MPLQATRNPEHLSMSRDSNCTKQIGLARVFQDGGVASRGKKAEAASSDVGLMSETPHPPVATQNHLPSCYSNLNFGFL
jgi:hypothetical protein